MVGHTPSPGSLARRPAVPASHWLATAAVSMTIAAGATRADFVQLSLEFPTFETEPGWSDNIFVVDVLAEFSHPDDEVWGVGRCTDNCGAHDPLTFATTAASFLNAQFGSNRPPAQIVLDLFPELNWDTFATIGPTVYADDQPQDDRIQFGPNFPGFSDNPVIIDNTSGWIVPPNFTDIGRAGNYPGFRVRLARLVIDTGGAAECISGIVNINIVDGASGMLRQIFDLPFGACACPWDLDGDRLVGATDLLVMLAAWGSNPGHPADFDGDDVVGATDLLELLANWGPCP